MIFNTDDRIQFRKQFIKNPTTVRHFISHFVLPSNSCHVSASGLGLWRADLGEQPRAGGGQGPGRAGGQAHGPNLAQVGHYIDIDVYSEFGVSQFTSGIISTLVNISSALSSLYTLYYSVTFSDVEH